MARGTLRIYLGASPGVGKTYRMLGEGVQLLDAGIDVISTVNIQHLESLNDVVSRTTGTTQRETVPDEIVRHADQIELVDMSPEAIRRRMAHGNIYPAERIDAALANYFRPGSVTTRPTMGWDSASPSPEGSCRQWAARSSSRTPQGVGSRSRSHCPLGATPPNEADQDRPSVSADQSGPFADVGGVDVPRRSPRSI